MLLRRCRWKRGPVFGSGPGEQPALRHQASGLGSLRSHQLVPGARRRPPDQDGAGSQAWRGRGAAGPQGDRGHRGNAPLCTRGGLDLAAPSSRHLLHRGPGRVDLRLEVCQPQCQDFRQTGLRSGCWCRCIRCRESKFAFLNLPLSPVLNPRIMTRSRMDPRISERQAALRGWKSFKRKNIRFKNCIIDVFLCFS